MGFNKNRALQFWLVVHSVVSFEIDSVDDFDELVKEADKNSLVKFFAPWCGHCKRMQPHFDELAARFEPHPFIQLVDVDCTSDGGGDVLCQRHGVTGFPTLKYFLNYRAPRRGVGFPYNMSVGTSKEQLEQFIAANLEIPCDVATLDGCNEPKELAFLVQWRARSAADIVAEDERLREITLFKVSGLKKKAWLRRRRALIAELAMNADRLVAVPASPVAEMVGGG